MKLNIKLTKKEEIANGTMAFHFAKPDGFEFRAGQFGDIRLLSPPETDEEGDIRGFSFANAPYESEIIVATRMRDTAFKRVMKDLPVGSGVELDGPYGDFTLHKTESTPAVFIIGGIGVTPVRSMVAQATHEKTSHQITLLHSSRTPADLPYMKDFEGFANENNNFTYVPVASDESPDDWQGETGRIDGELIRKHIDDLTKPIYYLSGPEGMVRSMRQLLIDIGANEDNIKTEEFSGY